MERREIVSKLFDKTRIRGLTLPNRFIRSATWEAMAAEDGSCTQQLMDTMVQLAHAGCQGDVELTGQEALGPSALRTENGPMGREMTH